jgi:hypothetical protein
MTTRRRKMMRPQTQQQVQLGPQDISRAARTGVTLLNTPDAVKVDGPMALSGDLQILNILLSNLASGALQVVQPTPEAELPEEEDPDIPEGEDENGDS